MLGYAQLELPRPRGKTLIDVIVNADDFGLTDGVCTGIAQAIHAGGVTATTAMVCAPGAIAHLTRWAPRIPGRIGAHLQLTSGKPVLEPGLVPSLVDANGMFPASRKQLGELKTEEVLAEWQAQIEVLLRVGIEPTHLDSHHHIHSVPAAFAAFVKIAGRCGIPARSVEPEMTHRLHEGGIPCAARTLLGWYGGDLSIASLQAVLEAGTRDCPPACVVEVMSHPGLVDEGLPSVSRYVEDRSRELEVLCDSTLQEKLETAGFRLCGFQSLVS